MINSGVLERIMKQSLIGYIDACCYGVAGLLAGG